MFLKLLALCLHSWMMLINPNFRRLSSVTLNLLVSFQFTHCKRSTSKWLLSPMWAPLHCIFGTFTKQQTLLRFLKLWNITKLVIQLPCVQSFRTFSFRAETFYWPLLCTETSRTLSLIPSFSVIWWRVPFVCVWICLDVFTWLSDSQLLSSSWRQRGARTRAHVCFALPTLTHLFHLAICRVTYYIE